MLYFIRQIILQQFGFTVNTADLQWEAWCLVFVSNLLW